MVDEQIRLINFQLQLEREVEGRIKVYDLNLADTIETCIKNGLNKKAERLKSDFKMPDKKWAVLIPFNYATQIR